MLLKSLLFVFKHQDLQILGDKLNNMSNCHPHEVVDRGSEKQLQVGENLNYIIFSALKVEFHLLAGVSRDPQYYTDALNLISNICNSAD